MRGIFHNFEVTALPHLHAAYKLARLLTRNEKDAEDIVQEAFLRAFRHFGSFHGGDARPWLLTIVRNTYYTWMQHNRSFELQTALDDQIVAHDDSNPETLLLKEAETALLRQAMEELSPEFRELIVLREFEELSYKQIAKVAMIPIGTVMSRLARARRHLKRILSAQLNAQTPKEVELGTV
jgi:RNA polymerase sigma-70 factor (ECF subfamily)